MGGVFKPEKMTVLERSEGLLDGVKLDFESWQELALKSHYKARFSKSNIPYPERVRLQRKIAILRGLNIRPSEGGGVGGGFQ